MVGVQSDDLQRRGQTMATFTIDERDFLPLDDLSGLRSPKPPRQARRCCVKGKTSWWSWSSMGRARGLWSSGTRRACSADASGMAIVQFQEGQNTCCVGSERIWPGLGGPVPARPSLLCTPQAVGCVAGELLSP